MSATKEMQSLMYAAAFLSRRRWELIVHQSREIIARCTP
jgi:hypothetical protein